MNQQLAPRTRSLSLCLLSLLMLSLLLLCLALPAAAERHVELILDASGSMYNKLDDGRYRIVAAKEALEAFVDGLPADDLQVALRIYGARLAADTPGACEDSELTVPMAPLDREALRTAIRSTRARGKTPIAYSLEQALGDFPADSEACVVVLVTDGKEVCDGDLKAAAQQLKEHGCDVDRRIIGFDLDADAAASFEGLGHFENAADAGQLASALHRAVEKVVEISPLGEASLEAPEEVSAGQLFEVRWQGEDGYRDYVTMVAADAKDGKFGDYVYTATGNPMSFYAPITPGDYELRYQSDRVDGVAARRAVRVVSSEIALGGPREVPAGQPFEIPWKGPNGPRDYITLVQADAADGAYTTYAYTKAGSPARLHAPITPGDYELRYQSDREDGVFARRALVVKPVEIMIDAPATVSAGEQFEIAWQGPNGDQDYITLVPADAAPGAYKEYSYTRKGPTLTLHAPLEGGNYELRYQTDREDGVFARVPITIDGPPKVTLNAPSEVAAGSSFEVEWTGPNGQQDYITIAPKGSPDGTYKDYAYTRVGPTVTLQAPDEPGDFEVRYQSDRVKNVVFGKRPIRVQ